MLGLETGYISGEHVHGILGAMLSRSRFKKPPLDPSLHNFAVKLRHYSRSVPAMTTSLSFRTFPLQRCEIASEQKEIFRHIF